MRRNTQPMISNENRDEPYWIVASGIGQDGGFGDYANPGILHPIRDKHGRTYWFTSHEDADEAARVLSRSASAAFTGYSYSGDFPVEYRSVMVFPRRAAPVTEDGVIGFIDEVTDANRGSWSVPCHEDEYTRHVKSVLEDAVRNAPNYRTVLDDFTKHVHEDYDDDLKDDGIVFTEDMITTIVTSEREYSDRPIDALVEDEMGRRGAHLLIRFNPFKYDDDHKNDYHNDQSYELASADWSLRDGVLKRPDGKTGDYHCDYDEIVNDLPSSDADCRVRQALGFTEESDEWHNVDFEGLVYVDGRSIGEILYSPDLSTLCFSSSLRRSRGLDSIGVVTGSTLIELEDKMTDALNDKINKISKTPNPSKIVKDRIVTFEVSSIPGIASSEDESDGSMAAWEKGLVNETDPHDDSNGGLESVEGIKSLSLHEDRNHNGWLIREVDEEDQDYEDD
jgi:hypothetical protein